jgi:DNA-binding GntR family transcriptional regulator
MTRHQANSGRCAPRREVIAPAVLSMAAGEKCAGMSTSGQAYLALRSTILDMNVDPNSNLRLRPRMLSRSWGMSRTPIREAIARLEREGLVNILPRRGAFLARKTKAELLDIFIVWAALSSAAARLTALHASNYELARLHKLAGRPPERRRRSTVAGFLAGDLRFHTEIIGLSGCRSIAALSEGLLLPVPLAAQKILINHPWAEQSVFERERIADALQERDQDHGERLTREHILGLREYFKEMTELQKMDL